MTCDSCLSSTQIESLQRQKGKLVSDLEDASQWHKEDLETQQLQYFQVRRCPIPATWESESPFSISGVIFYLPIVLPRVLLGMLYSHNKIL